MSVPQPSSFHPDRDIPDLSGKVILVTGGNAGIGASIVHALAAHHPSCIYLCARTPRKAETVIANLQQQFPRAKIRALQLDLNSFESIRACAKVFLDDDDGNGNGRLDQLYLNAGISGTAPGLTEEGYENTFGEDFFSLCFFTLPELPPTGTYLRWYQKERKKERKEKRCLGLISLISFF